MNSCKIPPLYFHNIPICASLLWRLLSAGIRKKICGNDFIAGLHRRLVEASYESYHRESTDFSRAIFPRSLASLTRARIILRPRRSTSSTTCNNGTRTSEISPDLPDWPTTRLEFHSHTARSTLGTYTEYKTTFPWIERYGNTSACSHRNERNNRETFKVSSSIEY